MRKLLALSFVLVSTPALAGNANPWYLPGKIKEVVETYLVLNANTPQSIIICYSEGSKDAYIDVNSSDASGNAKVRTVSSRLYVGGCLNAHGTLVWIKNPNKTPAKGTFTK